MSHVKEHKYLIIAGAPKAGTTSLFNYLASHPQICEATIKETNFFLDADYPAPPICPFKSGLDKYDKLFRHSEFGLVRMEATPYYLYSKGTPLKIKESLPNARLLFILREPVSFLISAYKSRKQIGSISINKTFDEYIEEQLQSIKHEKTELNTIPISMGRYSVYLRTYINLFNKDMVKIFFYEDFAKDNKSTLQEICVFADIDPIFYEDYDFKIFNRTVTIKNSNVNRIFYKINSKLSNATYNKPTVRRILQRIKYLIFPLVFSLNISRSEDIVLSQSLKELLYEYYRQEKDALEDLLNVTVPWKIGHQ